MFFKRELRNKEVIELTGTVAISLGIVFKQFDTGTSTMILETSFNGEPTPFTNEKVYLVYKLKDKHIGTLIPVENASGVEIKDVCTYATSINNGILEVEVDKEVLKYSGEMFAELIILSEDETNRFTSPTLKFRIEPSLSPNSGNAIVGEVKCGEVVCGEGITQRTTAPVKSFLGENITKKTKE